VIPGSAYAGTVADVGRRLQKEVEAFVEYVSPTKAEDEVRGLVVNLITRAVVRNFPDAKVMPFGSFETKLYLPSG
jgi:non-canonical poly(A) RNA polymerase PAPD5/7